MLQRTWPCLPSILFDIRIIGAGATCVVESLNVERPYDRTTGSKSGPAASGDHHAHHARQPRVFASVYVLLGLPPSLSTPTRSRGQSPSSSLHSFARHHLQPPPQSQCTATWYVLMPDTRRYQDQCHLSLSLPEPCCQPGTSNSVEERALTTLSNAWPTSSPFTSGRSPLASLVRDLW